jgi:hypothetical protein
VPDEGMHPFWHLAVEMDLKERIANRKVQRAYLARYGRQDFFDYTRTTPEQDAAMKAISQIVKQENEFSRMSEDH